MLTESLAYFVNYNAIIQLSINLNALSKYIQCNDDILFYFLDNEVYSDIGRSLVDHIDNKYLLKPYLSKYADDFDFTDKLLSYDVFDCDESFVRLCCRYGNLNMVKHLLTLSYVSYNIDDLFICACYNNQLETAKYIFEEHVKATTSYTSGQQKLTIITC